MAIRPQARAPQASAEDDFYGEDLDQGTEGSDDLGQERDDYDETGDASEHSGQGDPEFEEENELAGEDPPQPRRGEGRIQRLANENRDLRRRLEDYEQRRPDPQRPTGPRQETNEEFAARISLLSPEEKLDAKFERFTQLQAAQNQQTQLQQTLDRDRDDFRQLARSDKRVARLADDVEREFDKRFRAGFLVPRRDIAKWLIGERFLEGDSQGKNRAREQAQRRVERQTVRPSSGGSDVRAGRREKTDDRTARAKRLEGVQI